MNVQLSAAPQAAEVKPLSEGEFLSVPRLLPFKFDHGLVRIHYGFVPRGGKQVLACVAKSNCAPSVMYASPDDEYIKKVVGENKVIKTLLGSDRMMRMPYDKKENVTLLEDVRRIIDETVPAAIQALLPHTFDYGVYAVRCGVVQDDGMAVTVLLVRHFGAWATPNESLYKRILDHEEVVKLENEGAVFPKTASENSAALGPHEEQLGLK